MELASDTAAAPNSGVWQQAREELYEELGALHTENAITQWLLTAAPSTEFTTLIAAEGDRAMDYLLAARWSYARLQTAEGAGERDWISKHDTAARKYLALAAEALRRHAIGNENSAAKLQSERFAVRRPPNEAGRVLEQLKRDGLSEEHRKLLRERKLTPEGINAYQGKLQAMTAAEVGISMIELYQKIADARRQLAVSLDEFVRDHRRMSGPLGESFLVGNPHEREAVVQLIVRRVAMPPEWTISLSEVESNAAEKPAQRLREVEKGKRYEVKLPAKGEIRVVSEITPIGVVAEHTTARWAIEGMIGGELLSGIVQEVNVPGFLPDLQLPPIGTVQPPITAGGEADATTQPTTLWQQNVVLISAVVVALFLIAVAVLALRRRKRA
jgi:hypothetical protein